MNYLQTVFVYLAICVFVYLRPVYSSVILNEVAIQPTQSVELYNTDSSLSADISSWYIDDSGGSTYFTIPPNTSLPPLSCLVFSSDFNFNKSSTDTIRLIDNSYVPTTSSAVLIDSYQYTKAPETGYSFTRKLNDSWEISTSSLGLFNDSLVSCIPTPTPEPTPTEMTTPTQSPNPTQIPNPSSTPVTPTDYTNIYLSEIFPYPEVGSNEWVELYNANDFAVNLVDWYIDDAENSGGTPRRFTVSINQHEYKSIEIVSSLFNNAGDIVRLLNAEKQEKDSMEYGKVMRGNSIGRISFDEDTYCEQTPSQNNTNSVCLGYETSSPSSVQSSTIQPTKKSIIPTAKKNMSQTVPYTQLHPINNQEGEILGETAIENKKGICPIPYLSGVSFSYSALTIVSLFIKMRNA